jgi:alpha-tubulin suppressor-like RCC1 family protein
MSIVITTRATSADSDEDMNDDPPTPKTSGFQDLDSKLLARIGNVLDTNKDRMGLSQVDKNTNAVTKKNVLCEPILCLQNLSEQYDECQEHAMNTVNAEAPLVKTCDYCARLREQLGNTIAVGNLHSLAIRKDGAIVGWGQNEHGEVPENARPGPFVSVAASNMRSFGLRSDGVVEYWGLKRPTYPERKPGPFQAITAGYHFVVGLLPNGHLDIWGDVEYANEEVIQNGGVFIPNGLHPGSYTAISACYHHLLALRLDGSVDHFGTFNHVRDCLLTRKYDGPYTAIAAGNYHSLFLRQDGNIVEFEYENDIEVMHVIKGPFVKICAGKSVSCGIREDGTIHVWGSDSFGVVSNTPTHGNFLSVSLGAHAIGLHTDGTIQCWGGRLNIYGQAPTEVLPGPFKV